jgi:hypothetical protein
MSPKEATALRLDTALLDAMRSVKDRIGIPVTVQIEKAVRDWLKREHGIIVKAPNRRVSPRRG